MDPYITIIISNKPGTKDWQSYMKIAEVLVELGLVKYVGQPKSRSTTHVVITVRNVEAVIKKLAVILAGLAADRALSSEGSAAHLLNSIFTTISINSDDLARTKNYSIRILNSNGLQMVNLDKTGSPPTVSDAVHTYFSIHPQPGPSRGAPQHPRLPERGPAP